MERNLYGHIVWFFIVLVLSGFVSAIFLFNRNKPRPTLETPVPVHRKGRVYTVFFISGVFSPTNMQITVGDTVRFRNDSLAPIQIVSDLHPDHEELPGFDSISEIFPQGVFSYTFVAKGVFGYHNEESVEQEGTIIVR